MSASHDSASHGARRIGHAATSAAAAREARRLLAARRPGNPVAAVEPLEGRRLMSVVTASMNGSADGDEGNEQYYDLGIAVTVDKPGGWWEASLDWGDGWGSEAVGEGGAMHVYPDGDHTYTATLTVIGHWTETDENENEYGASETVTKTCQVSVANVEPTFTLTPSSMTPLTGDTVSVGVSDYFDPAYYRDTVSGWSIDWGDGTTDNYTGNPSSFDHAYAYESAGAKTITATATDEDGSYSQSTTINVTAAQRKLSGKGFEVLWAAAGTSGTAQIKIEGDIAKSDYKVKKVVGPGVKPADDWFSIEGKQSTSGLANGTTDITFKYRGPPPVPARTYTITIQTGDDPNITCDITIVVK